MTNPVQHLVDSSPPWANWLIIVGGAVTSWLVPVASFVATVWGLMQMYSWIVNKQWRRKDENYFP